MDIKKLENQKLFLLRQLKLSSWDVMIKPTDIVDIREMMDSDNCEACIEVNYPFMKADVFIDKDTERAFELLLHELLHLVFFDLDVHFNELQQERSIYMISNLILTLYDDEVNYGN